MARDWKTVDWSKQDVTIARELGCTRERVRQKRFLLGKPRSPFHGAHHPMHETPTAAKARKLHLKIEKLCTGQICRALGVCDDTARRNFPERRVKRYDWSRLIPDVCRTTSDAKLARAVGCSPDTLVNKRLSLGIYRQKPWGRRRARRVTIVGKTPA